MAVLGCGRSPAPETLSDADRGDGGPPAKAQPAYEEVALARPSAEEEAPAAANVASKVSLPKSQPILKSPPEIEARYLQTGVSAAEREGLLAELAAIGTPQAVDVLGRLFSRDKELDLRFKVLEVVANVESEETREARFRIWSSALSQNQPRMLRIAAINSINPEEEPRFKPILRKLAGEGDREVREMAKEILNLQVEPR